MGIAEFFLFNIAYIFPWSIHLEYWAVLKIALKRMMSNKITHIASRPGVKDSIA